jgi:hypothetical protein
MGTDAGFFQLHVKSLERFAAELDTQLDALRGPTDRLTVLAGTELPLGGFAEAQALGQRELTVTRQMLPLLQALRDAVAFAGEVTRAVAGQYQQFDERAVAAYGSAASGTPTPGG